MSVECIGCGEPIDIHEVYLLVTPRQGFRDSWCTYARLHVGCFTGEFGEGEFDAHEWAGRVS